MISLDFNRYYLVKSKALFISFIITLLLFVSLVFVSTSSVMASAIDSDIIYVSFQIGGVTSNNIAFGKEDILAYRTATDEWSLYFDGSDVGLSGRNVNAFHQMADGSLLFSFLSEGDIPDVGPIDGSDIVRFIPTQLGNDTTGTFELYFDGSDVGLEAAGENIDAVTMTADGRLVISTSGYYDVGFNGRPTDLILFTHASLGENTSGTWAKALDGQSIGLDNDSAENLWGAWLDPLSNKIYLKTWQAFALNGVSGSGSEVFTCTPPNSNFPITTCDTTAIYWNGFTNGTGTLRVDALSVSPYVPGPVWTPTPKLRVIEVRYFPYGEGDVIYHPDDLSAQLQASIQDASRFHYYQNPDAVPNVEVEVVAVYNRLGTRPAPDTPEDWYSTYEKILIEDNLCGIILAQDIDQVWVWADPRPGYDPNHIPEYVISSRYFEAGAAFATTASPAFCGGSRSFTAMGFDTSRPADNALHSFGHFMEGLLGNVQSVELFWDRYGGDDAAGFPRSERCGNVHFPPNGTADYDYANPTYVNTACEDWNPQGTGEQTSTNCERWGCTQEGYLLWWMQNMPAANNGLTYQGKLLPNWWHFIYDMDAQFQYYLDHPEYYLNLDFFHPYPPGIMRVDTDPIQIQGQKELRKLFDGITDWPNTAIVHYVEYADVGVIIEFDNPTELNKFDVTVAGASGGSAAYSWVVETADTWDDMVNNGSSKQIILRGYQTYQEGTVQVPFAPHTAKVFKITASRDNGNGIVHLLELLPLP